MARKKSSDWFVCPHCGADVPVGAKVCRECGSDDETGWSEGEDVWKAEIGTGYGDEEDFDYDEFVQKELPEHAAPNVKRSLTKWILVALVMLLCIGLLRFVGR